MAGSYEAYYGSNTYDERYPSENRLTLSRVSATIRPESLLVDVGAGNGRYAIPLARLGHRVVAIERSTVARAQLESRVGRAGVAPNVDIYADLSDVPAVDLARASHVLLLFGVLGHMTFGERRSVLGFISTSMPSVRSVIGSVPNRHRRFSDEQRTDRVVDGGPGRRFTYSRMLSGISSAFEYTGFSPGELRTELATHGWQVARLAAESTTAEEMVTTHQLIGRLDRILSTVLTPSLGYGIYFEAVPARCARCTIDQERGLR